MFENYNISLFNRKGKLYIQYHINGKQKQKSTRLEDTPTNRKFVRQEVIPQLILKLKSGELDKKNKPEEFYFYAKIFLRQKENLKTYNELSNIVTNQIISYFGKKTIVDKITRGQVKKWVDKLLQDKSSNRVKAILNALKAILDIAVDYEHISQNPAQNIKLPKHIRVREMQPFNEEQVKLLLNNADGFFRNYLAIAFYTGMRPGEIMALTLSDIHLDEMYIDVNKRLKKGNIGTPKTKSGIRKVPILNNLVPYLKNQIEYCKQNRVLVLFFNPNTKKRFFDADRLHPHWKKLLNKCNIPYRVMYNTRHTFASLMIKNGVNIAKVSQTLGHKNINETLTIYTKFLPNENLNIDRNLDPFTDNLTDNRSKKPS